MDTLKLKTVGLFHSDDLEFLQDLVSIVDWQWEEERVVSCPCQGQSHTVDTVTHVHTWLVVAAGRELRLAQKRTREKETAELRAERQKVQCIGQEFFAVDSS